MPQKINGDETKPADVKTLATARCRQNKTDGNDATDANHTIHIISLYTALPSDSLIHEFNMCFYSHPHRKKSA